MHASENKNGLFVLKEHSVFLMGKKCQRRNKMKWNRTRGRQHVKSVTTEAYFGTNGGDVGDTHRLYAKAVRAEREG